MEVRYLQIEEKVYKVIRTAEPAFFLEARSLPLPNIDQFHNRRLDRWHRHLQDYGWDAEELPGLSLDSELARFRATRRNGEAEASAESTAPEQSLRLEALLFLLLWRSCHRYRQRRDVEPENTFQAEAARLFESITKKLEGEIEFGSEIISACPVADGLVDIQVLHQLRNQGLGQAEHHYLSSRLAAAASEAGLPTFLQVGAACLSARLSLQLPKQFCQSIAALWHQQLSEHWPTLPSNPLAAGARPLKGPKRKRRIDPEISKIFSESAASGGPQALLALQRHSPAAAEWLGAVRTVNKHGAGEHAKHQHVQCEIQKIRSYGKRQYVPRLSIACDASRVGGEKTMVFLFTWLQEQISCWPCPQSVRDFAETAESDPGQAASLARDRWVYGMKNFFEDISASIWWETTTRMVGTDDPAQLLDSEKKLGKVPKLQRLSSYDVLVALDQSLRTAGLSLADFSPASCVNTMQKKQKALSS